MHQKVGFSDQVEVERFKNLRRRKHRIQTEKTEENADKGTTEDLVETIVERFLEEQESAREENTLKIEIVKKFSLKRRRE